MAANDHVHSKKLVLNIKEPELSKLYKMLNRNDKWEELAELMGYSASDIKDLKSDKNPTKQLFRDLIHQNCTIDDLFVLLSEIDHRQSMKLLQPFVDEEYHRLIDIENDNSTSVKDLKIARQNFNQSELNGNNERKVSDKFFDKDFGDQKIINVSPQPSISTAPSLQNNLSTLQPVAGTSQINNENPISLVDGVLPEIAYKELTQATDNWTSYVSGKGSFGGTVYRGNWKQIMVAIKKIEKPRSEIMKNCLMKIQHSREFKILKSYGHDNILLLEGFSFSPEATCLVYRLMINGSLEDSLFVKKNLPWLQRHKIAKGIARGLLFLHTVVDKPLIHGDLKSANIFLDRNFEPRIKDFALLRRASETDSAKMSALSTKSDIYKFGLVLFELATGLPAYDDARLECKHLKELTDDCKPEHLKLFKDVEAGTKNTQVFTKLIELGQSCSKFVADERPEMIEVFRQIDELKFSQ